MELVDLIQTYKTKKCDKVHEPSLSTSKLSCPMFHSKDDKRRPPFSSTRTALIYSHSYLEDYYSTQMASNLLEYLFHPDIFKTTPCKDRLCVSIKGKFQIECKDKWCPYLHEGEDVSFLNRFRNLPVLMANEQAFCERIDAAEDLRTIIKGGRDLICGPIDDKIASIKAHLKSLAGAYLSQIPDPVVAVAANVPPAPAGNRPQEKENWYTQYQYFYHTEKLPLFEDRHHEFKNYWDIVNNNIAPIVMKYISAFLNSDGGVLYVGIDDNSIVSGFEMSQHEFDKFMLNIDSESKLNMLPPLLPHKYSIRRIPVINTKKGKELWVIEIKVTPSELDKRNRVLTLYNRQAFMRMNASVHKLDTVNIIEYIRHHEEERQEQKSRIDILQEFSRGLDRKDKPLSLQECLDLKEKMGRLGERVEEVAAGLRRKEGEKS